MSNRLSLRAPCNDDRFGIAFDPTLCSANHSCDPNTSYIFNQPETLLRAIRPIKKGDEVTMRYIDVTNPYSVRQDELQKKYYFTCHCPKCQLGPTTDLDTFLKPPTALAEPFTTTADGLITRHASILSTHLAPGAETNSPATRRLAALQAEAFATTSNPQASEAEIKDALKLLLNSGFWPTHRQPVPQLLRQLLNYYLLTRQKYAAWRVALKLHFSEPPGRRDDAERVIDLHTLAFFTNTLCQPDMAHIRQECMEAGLDLMVVFVGFLFEARDLMPRTYGMESPFGKVVGTLYEQVMARAPVEEAELRERVREVWPKLEVVAESVDVVNL